ncbi:MAG: class I SAM-dependent methyltransferase [Anaerolineales bacterium]|nr:class I SAM-dependent methyltransferase [Anaerolineales bacterium]
MNDKLNLDLGNVQKTLFLPLWGRAVESRKDKPLLIDETAVHIIDQVDFDFSKITRNIDEITQIAWIKRSLFCDRVVKQFLASYPQGTIVNIGCGLDTTYERTDNGTLKWYDLDLPDVIELRSKFIQGNERRKFLAGSFLEEEWLNHIEVNGNVLFIAAGVFYYFEEQEIKGFIVRLIDAYPNSEILFDVSSPTGVRVANKKVIESSGLDERSYLKWGPKNKNDILAWDPRISLIGAYYYFRSLRMSLRNILMGTLSDFLGIQYMLHLRLGNSA